MTEDALLRLHLLGLGEDLFINHADTLDVTERMILRATVLRTGKLNPEIYAICNISFCLSMFAFPFIPSIYVYLAFCLF